MGAAAAAAVVVTVVVGRLMHPISVTKLLVIYDHSNIN